MKKLFRPLIIIVLFSFVQCKKEHTPLTIILHDKPLSTIQHYVVAKWKLQYAYGGISPMKYVAKNNSYTIIYPDRIVIGNDSAGVIVDTVLIWKRAKDIFNDSTYLLTYSYPQGYAFPFNYVVDKIYKDTLILIDNLDDFFSYYYTKAK